MLKKILIGVVAVVAVLVRSRPRRTKRKPITTVAKTY